MLKLGGAPSGGPKHVTFNEHMLALPPPSSPLAIPKLEPYQKDHSDSETFDNVPAETALKLKVRALENQLKYSRSSHEDEIVKLASDKMDLQLRLAKLKR